MFYSQISINSDINNLSELEMFIDEVMDNYHIEEQYYGILSVPLIESTKNAIIHGNKNNVQKKVTISIQKNDKEIQCSVSDEGSGFDYDSIINSPIEKITTNGLLKIKSLSEKITFYNNGATISYSQNIPTIKQKHSKAKLIHQNNSKIIKTKMR